MFSRIPTRAIARALTLLVGVFLGLTVEAVCLAAARPPATAAAVYAAALKSGYDRTPPTFSVNPIVVRPPMVQSRSLDCLAAAVYYEARGESAEGRAAVAQVVLNRVRAGSFPDTVCAVVYQGARSGDCQFSFVCDGAMKEPRETAAWLDARRIAGRALQGHVVAAIGKAIFFHAADGRTPAGAVRLGGHVFHS